MSEGVVDSSSSSAAVLIGLDDSLHDMDRKRRARRHTAAVDEQDDDAIIMSPVTAPVAVAPAASPTDFSSPKVARSRFVGAGAKTYYKQKKMVAISKSTKKKATTSSTTTEDNNDLPWWARLDTQQRPPPKSASLIGEGHGDDCNTLPTSSSSSTTDNLFTHLQVPRDPALPSGPFAHLMVPKPKQSVTTTTTETIKRTKGFVEKKVVDDEPAAAKKIEEEQQLTQEASSSTPSLDTATEALLDLSSTCKRQHDDQQQHGLQEEEEKEEEQRDESKSRLLSKEKGASPTGAAKAPCVADAESSHHRSPEVEQESIPFAIVEQRLRELEMVLQQRSQGSELLLESLLHQQQQELSSSTNDDVETMLVIAKRDFRVACLRADEWNVQAAADRVIRFMMKKRKYEKFAAAAAVGATYKKKNVPHDDSKTKNKKKIKKRHHHHHDVHQCHKDKVTTSHAAQQVSSGISSSYSRRIPQERQVPSVVLDDEIRPSQKAPFPLVNGNAAAVYNIATARTSEQVSSSAIKIKSNNNNKLTPHPDDCVLGRGRANDQHPGNVLFRQLLKDNFLKEYTKTPHFTRSYLAIPIQETLQREHNMRFLTRIEDNTNTTNKDGSSSTKNGSTTNKHKGLDGEWVLADDATVKQKILRTLRRLQLNERKQQEREQETASSSKS